MKTVIAVIAAANFVETNYDEVLQGKFKEFVHKSVSYMRINTFEKYVMGNMFEEVFYTEAEFEAWLLEVPASITKLQAVKQLLTLGLYNDLIAALESDITGESKILFDSASRLDRNSNMVNNIATALGMSSDDVDTFFVEANQILI